MSDKTSLGDRMKGYEEAVGQTLLRRTPVIVRVDGKAFHTFTRRITEHVEPDVKYHFSKRLHNVMMLTAGAMMLQMQNCQMAYTQSDEISFLFNDWKTLDCQQWFDAKTQKIISVSAAMAATYFNHFWSNEFGDELVNPPEGYDSPRRVAPDYWAELALFDSRAFNVPREDVDNYFIWRQRDAMRNSVNYIARKFFSHKKLEGLNGLQVKNKLFAEHGVQWDEYPTWEKRGACVHRHMELYLLSDKQYVTDDEIPVFTENREYITRFLRVEDEPNVRT